MNDAQRAELDRLRNYYEKSKSEVDPIHEGDAGVTVLVRYEDGDVIAEHLITPDGKNTRTR